MDAPNQWQPKRRQEGRIIFGIAVVAIGILLLLQMFHMLPPILYTMHFGWPLILIIVGIAMGVRHNFRNNAWWILILVGVANLIPSFYIGDVPSRRLFWPALLVLGGLAIMFRKKGPRDCRRFGRWQDAGQWQDGEKKTILNTVDTDVVNIDVTFSGRKEIVTSKNFRGGVVRASFSGVELNLAGAENSSGQPMELDVYASFAGVEIIVPAHWEIQNEIRPTMGSVEDNRVIRTGDTSASRPLLVLRGSVNLGSVELKSY